MIIIRWIMILDKQYRLLLPQLWAAKIYTYGYNVIADPPSAYTDLSPTLYPISALSSSGGSSSKGGSSCFAGNNARGWDEGYLRGHSWWPRVGSRCQWRDPLLRSGVRPPSGQQGECSLRSHHYWEWTWRDVTMTKNLILPAGVCGFSVPLVYAFQVSVGDCIMTINGQEKVSSVKQPEGHISCARRIYYYSYCCYDYYYNNDKNCINPPYPPWEYMWLSFYSLINSSSVNSSSSLVYPK